MLETALNEEMTEHLGYDKHDPAGQGAGSGNIRNGTRPKTVLTEAPGQVEIDVPRDRAGTFEPQIVRKRQRRLTGVDEMVLSLYAKGLTTGEISAHFAEIYGASVSKETISPDHRQGDRGDEGLAAPAAGRGLRGGVHRRHRGQGPRRAGRQPAHLRRDRRHPRRRQGHPRAVGRHRRRGRQVLDGVLTDLRNRGIADVFFLVCDGLKGLPDVVANVWPQTIVQTCIIHLIRNTFRLASTRDWDALKRDVKPIYTAVNAAAARAAFDELAEKWGARYPAIVRLWDNAWEEFIPFLDYDVEIRTVLCSHQRDRVAERPLPAGGQGPRPLPHRAGRAKVPVPGHPVPGPDRDRQNPMDDAMEARSQRVRHHLRRPVPGRRNLLTNRRKHR